MSTERLVDVDPQNAPGNLDDLETSLREAVTETKKPETAAESQSAQPADKPDWIKPKFWTGDLEESMRKQAESYESLESAYGRMANDLGTQRKLTDRLLAMDKRDDDLGKPKKEIPKVDPSKLVDNPSETLEEWYSARRAQEKEQEEATSSQARSNELEQQFYSNHPDWQEVAASKDFAEWVQASPTRVTAASYAGQGDWGSAQAMLDEYKAAQTSASRKEPEGDDVEAARKAGLESAAQASGTGSTRPGKIYRRADLIELKLSRPDVYSDPTFQDEIMRAYQEGRVK